MNSFTVRVAKNGYIYSEDGCPGELTQTFVFTDPLQLIQHIRETHPVDTDSFVYNGKLLDE